MPDFAIQHEKLAQAVDILQEKKVDCWLTFVRETAHNADPALGLILGFDLTWQTALIVTRTGRRIAIAGRYDADNIKRMGGYDEVIGYDQSIRDELLRVLGKLKPRQIAINYSESDTAADGLSHGMYLTLTRYLQGSPYQLISAEHILNALRGRKSASEIARIRKAVRITEQIIDGVTAMLRPGLAETDIAEYIQSEFARRNVAPAWEPAYCPTVNCGPLSSGHAMPSKENVAREGQIIHIDLGIIADGYVSDMQRLWYLQSQGESGVPEPIQKAFRAMRASVETAAGLLKPGVRGWEVDAMARQTLLAAGYPEFMHGLGHHIGRTVHDGSTLLGPRWERYGQQPEGIVEAGNVFTIEPSIQVPDVGWIATEEDVLVTEDGLEWLSTPQTELMVVKASDRLQ
jgi:Xaa-Pro aminopeptidase